jgi:large repetitive protein
VVAPENSSNERPSTPWPEREDLAAETSSDSRGGLVMQATVLWMALIVLLAGVVAVLAVLGSQFLASAKTGVSLEQCANLGTVCDTDHPSRWQTGNLGQSNAEYYERDVVPYRAILTGLTPGEHYSIGIGWDTTKNGRQAMDFLATYNHTVTAADPCAGLACGTGTDVLGIPADPALAAQAISQWTGQNFTAFGARFHSAGETFPNTGNFCSGTDCVIAQNPSAYSPLGSFTGDRKNQINLSFEATHETVVVAWGGHLASRNDWGAEFSAAAIPGSPYHMRIEGFACSDATNCSVGQMDRSLNSSGVYLSGSIRIVKSVDIGEQSAPPAFGFEASRPH